MLETKQKLARVRKETFELDKKTIKMQEEVDHFKQHSAFRHTALERNIKIFETYNRKHRQNVEVN